MANTLQSAKRARQAVKRRARNMVHRTKFRTYQKRVNYAVAKKDAAAAKEAFSKFVSVADSVAGKGLVHANKTARLKSRLSAAVAKLATAA